MRPAGDSTTDARLLSFFDAPSEEKALNAFHRLWEATLVQRVRPYLLRQQIPADVRSDLEAETYIRVCKSLLRRYAPSDQPSPSQSTSVSLVIIADVEGFALAAVRSVLYNYFLAQNPVWRRLQQRVIAHLKQDDKITRWEQETWWMAGLIAWKGMSFRARSARARTFLNEEYAVFRQKALRNQEAAEIPLPELMFRIFHWIDSPLRQNRLVGYLIKLRRQEANVPLSWEEISADGEQQDESFWTEGMENGVVTKQALRQALCQDGLLDRVQRGVLLLKLDSAVLTGGLGLTVSQTADALNINLDALFSETGELLLPMPDNKIATLLNVQATETQTAAERVSTFYRMTARRTLKNQLYHAG